MDVEENEIPRVVTNSLLASGFPFQTAIAYTISQVPRCAVVDQEVPWKDEGGGDQFLDLVAVKVLSVMTVECKKTQKQVLTFLQPGEMDSNVNRVRCLFLKQIQDSTLRMELFCADWDLMPKSAEAAFCVASTSDSGRDQRMLERDAQLLIRGADAYAERYKTEFREERGSGLERVILPILVTNAKIFVAEYQPVDVSLQTGQLNLPPHTAISAVPWIRFRKAFTSENEMGDRTVFVVAATELSTFLDKLDRISPNPVGVSKVHVKSQR